MSVAIARFEIVLGDKHRCCYDDVEMSKLQITLAHCTHSKCERCLTLWAAGHELDSA